MSSHDLISFTRKPDTFSAGVSRINSIQRCGPSLFESGDAEDGMGTDCRMRFPICVHDDGMEAFFDVFVPGEGETFCLSESEAYRLLCHALVQHLPETAFGEAVESLTGMLEFYKQSPALIAPQEPVKLKAKVTGSYTAPVYPVSEE